MYAIMNLVTRKIVASGFANRESGKKERDKLNDGKKSNIYIIVRSDNHPHGISKVSGLTSWTITEGCYANQF